MEDWKVAGIVILAVALTATIIGATFLAFLNLLNQTVAYQQSYGYNTPYQSAPYPNTPVTPNNSSPPTIPPQPTNPAYPQQPADPYYPYQPPQYGNNYPYGYGFGGFWPWRGMM